MIAHFDCFSGAAGDMILGALIDAGADPEQIAKQLELLGDIVLTTEEVHRAGIRATKVHIEGRVEIARPSEAAQLIGNAGLNPRVSQLALAIFDRLARAEAKVHGVEIKDVHFHEINGVDTVGDIVGAALALQLLEIDGVSCSAVATGTGVVETTHGTLPLPSPAVTELLQGAPLVGRSIEFETVTPTGAAILAEIVQRWGQISNMTLAGVGYGAGTKEIEGIPNVVRVLVGDRAVVTSEGTDEIVLEVNIDDMNPEIFEWVSERLFSAGATDVWTTQIIGKKGRPAAIMSVLAPIHLEDELRRTLVTETSTIGVRTTRVSKWMLERRWLEVKVEGRPIRVKVAYQGGKPVNASPEYSDCAEVARQTGLPLKEVFRRALAAVDPLLGAGTQGSDRGIDDE